MPESRQKPDAHALAALTTGRLTSTVLEIAMDLDIFAKLKGKDLSLEEAGTAWGLPAPSTRVLAQYLCSAGLLLYREGKLSNSPLAEAYLVDDPASLSMLSFLLEYGSSVEEMKKKLQSPPPLAWYQIRDEGKEPQETDILDEFYEVVFF